jgi:hypothetical protein
MLTVICWKWRQFRYRSKFEGHHVNILRNMVKRHYPHPHEFVCITDDTTRIDKSIRTVELWDDYSTMQSPHGEEYPSCYRRLKLFSKDAAKIVGGKRFVWVDLDTVIVGDMSPLWNRPEDFVIWGDTHPKTPYNGSMVMMDAGARPQVWEKFCPRESPISTRRARMQGSDQAWIAYILGPHEARWGREDGVYSFRMDIKRSTSRDLPKDARVVFFHGNEDPWDAEVQGRYPWVGQSYR